MKLKCKCGNSIDDTRVPNPFSADLISDKNYFHFFDRIDDIIGMLERGEKMRLKEEMARVVPEALFDESHVSQSVSNLIDAIYLRLVDKVLRCEVCERIWIKDGASDKFQSYSKET